MVNYSKLVSHWLLPESVPLPALSVVEALYEKGIKVCCVGMENPKAPMYYVFVDRSFDAGAILGALRESEGLSADPNGSGIFSRQYVWVGFEAGVCTPT